MIAISRESRRVNRNDGDDAARLWRPFIAYIRNSNKPASKVSDKFEILLPLFSALNATDLKCSKRPDAG